MGCRAISARRLAWQLAELPLTLHLLSWFRHKHKYCCHRFPCEGKMSPGWAIPLISPQFLANNDSHIGACYRQGNGCLGSMAAELLRL